MGISNMPFNIPGKIFLNIFLIFLYWYDYLLLYSHKIKFNIIQGVSTMKKLASLILVAVFAVAVAFVGCKKEEAPAPEQVQEQPAEEAPAEAPAQK